LQQAVAKNRQLKIGAIDFGETDEFVAFETFEAYAKPYKYNGKDTWAIISFKSKIIK